MDFNFIDYFNSLVNKTNTPRRSKEEIIQELDYLYWRDKDTYLRKVSIAKITYRVFRTEQGKHLLKERMV